MGRDNLRKKEKTNGLVGAKTGGGDNLRKREKINGLVRAKNRRWGGLT